MTIEGLETGRPLRLIEITIAAETVNVLGHMRAAAYVDRFEDAFMAFCLAVGLTDAHLRHASTSPFLMDLHATYANELRTGDGVSISIQVLETDVRKARLILFMHATARGDLAATCELAIINMDLATRRPCPWSAAQLGVWQQLVRAHGPLPVPAQAGRAIGALAPRPATA